MKVINYRLCDLKKKHGIYEILNILNGKVYIGSAVNLQQRRSDHLKELRGNRHTNQKLQNAWNKYGESAFIFSVLEFVESEQMLIEREQYYIDSLRPFYNILLVAGSSLGFSHSKETRRKLSQSITYALSNPETRKKMSEAAKRRVQSKDTRRKISVSNYYRMSNPEVRERIRSALSVPIVQLSLLGDFVAEFPSVSSADRIGFRMPYVIDCLKGRLSSYKGYKFIYKKDFLC